MRIMEIAMIHVRHLVWVNDQSVPDLRLPHLGEMAQELRLAVKKELRLAVKKDLRLVVKK
jgi:hypothetical protein